MSKKPMTSLGDHVKMAARLEMIRVAATSLLHDTLQYHLPKSSREYKLAAKLIDICGDLTSYLDDVVCRDKPDGIDHWCTHVYYDIDDMDSDMTFSEYVNSIANKLARAHADRLSKMSGVEVAVHDYDSSRAKYFNDKAVVTESEFEFNELIHSLGDAPLYKLSASQIRDFCKDAIVAGVPPTNEQIESAVWRCRVNGDEADNAS